MTRIQVMIVDDHDMVRMGLRTYLSLDPELDVTAEAGSGLEAVAMLDKGLPSGLPDVILMDLMMPEMDGVHATAEIMKRHRGVKIIMLTSFLEDDKVVAAIEAGAVSYILKTVSSDQLIHVVKSAFGGMPVMNAEVSQALTRGLRRRSLQDGGDEEELTLREKEVLLLIAEGKANKEIAEELHISIKTVKTHVSNLLMKCGLEDRTKLAVYAHRKGLVQSG